MNKKPAKPKTTSKATKKADHSDIIKELIEAHTAMLQSAGLNFPPHNDCITKAREAIG